jgi:hypothetical protein
LTCIAAFARLCPKIIVGSPCFCAATCDSVPQSSPNKYVAATGYGLTVDVLCAGNGASGLKQLPGAIDCTGAVCVIGDAAACCYDPRFDQRTDGVAATASTDTYDFTDPGVQSITALRGAAPTRVIADGGRAHTNQLVAECSITTDRLPTTQSLGDTPLQGGSATYWTQMQTAQARLTDACP